MNPIRAIIAATVVAVAAVALAPSLHARQSGPGPVINSGGPTGAPHPCKCGY